MKTIKIISSFSRVAIVASTLFVSVPVLSACHHKSNDEDETFKESIVDDPARANRKAEERDRKDSIARQDSIRSASEAH